MLAGLENNSEIHKLLNKNERAINKIQLASMYTLRKKLSYSNRLPLAETDDVIVFPRKLVEPHGCGRGTSLITF